MPRERANDALTFLDAGLGVSRTEHGFRSRLVQQFLKREADVAVGGRRSGHGRASPLRRHLLPGSAPEAAHGPSGENLRQLLHILLRVAAVDAQRVQLEQFARVVFVEPAPLPSAASGKPRPTRAGTDRLEIVEVDEHRRMLRRCEQHVFEPAEDVRPDRLALVAAGERRDEHLRRSRDAQMIGPERDEPLDERPIRRHTLAERGTAFGAGNADKGAPRLLPGFPPRFSCSLRRLYRATLHGGGLADRAEGAKRIGNGLRRALRRSAQHRRVSLQLLAQPGARVADALALAGTCAEPESVEGAKGGIHESTSIPLDDNGFGRAQGSQTFHNIPGTP